MNAAYVVRRLFTLVVTLLVVSLVTFLVFEVIPGDPILTMLGPDADPALVELMRQEYGTDQPLLVRLGTWFRGVVTGDLGTSIRFTRPVASLILERVVISLMIATLAIIVVVLVAVPLGVLLAIHRRHWSEPIVSMGIQVGMAIPSFWLGIVLISVFGLMLRLFPTGGFVPPGDVTDTRLRVNATMVEEQLDALRMCAQRGRPFGSPTWVQTTARRLGLGFTLRGPGRPRKGTGNQ